MGSVYRRSRGIVGKSGVQLLIVKQYRRSWLSGGMRCQVTRSKRAFHHSSQSRSPTDIGGFPHDVRPRSRLSARLLVRAEAVGRVPT